MLVVQRDSPVQTPEDLRGSRIATELVGYTTRWFAERSIDVDVEFSWGATEAKVAEGLVDAIVEVTETGSTIRAHGLRIVCELFESNPQLIANPAAWADAVEAREDRADRPAARRRAARGGAGRPQDERPARQARRR